MAELHGGQIAARQLRAAGIDTIFGVVAGPMIEVFAGAQELGLKVVGGRHEMNMGFAASAWGYQTGQPGILVTGSGPGMTNAVTPMHVATESAMPLLVLGGSAFGSTRGVGMSHRIPAKERPRRSTAARRHPTGSACAPPPHLPPPLAARIRGGHPP